MQSIWSNEEADGTLKRLEVLLEQQRIHIDGLRRHPEIEARARARLRALMEEFERHKLL